MKEERGRINENMAKMITQVKLLPKHMMGTGVRSVNVIGSQEAKSLEEDNAYALFDDEVQYMANQMAGSCSRY